MEQIEPVIVRVDIGGLSDAALRNEIYPHVRERVVVAGRGGGSAFGLSVVRSDTTGSFSDRDVERLSGIAELLVSLLAKHADLMFRRPNVAVALTSLVDIEDCIVEMTQLPRREVEVCARVLHGISTLGMSIDLGIGEESIKTYRKRAYRRLGIGTERELLNWYLALWSNWKYRTAGRVSNVASQTALSIL
jgi:DNA-binding CsgD family transcriptional regulator